MGRMSDIMELYGWRTVVGGPILLVGGILFWIMPPFGMLVLFIGAVIVAPLITEILAEPFRAIFYPDSRADGPAPLYGIPSTKKARGQYEEAIADYRTIAVQFPKETKPYFGMIETAIVNLHDPDRARTFLHEAFAKFAREPETCQIIQRHFEAMLTRVKPDPAWLDSQKKRVIGLAPPPAVKPVEEPDGESTRRFHAGGSNILATADSDGTGAAATVGPVSAFPPAIARPATDMDVPAVIPMWHQLMERHGQYDTWFVPAPFNDSQAEGFFRTAAVDSRRLLLVAESGSQIVGYLAANIREQPDVFRNRTFGVISEIFVQPAFRRHGVGRSMVQFTRKWMKERQVNRIEARTLSANRDAAAFWFDQGFYAFSSQLSLTFD